MRREGPRCLSRSSAGSRSRRRSSRMSPRGWRGYGRSCRASPPSAPGATSSSGTGRASGTRSTRWAHEHGQRTPDPREVVPFVQESVFLHHPRLRCELPATSRIDLFGLNGEDGRSGLPGISERLLEPPTPHQSVPAHRDQIIGALLENVGVVQRRQREAGSWVIDEEPIGEGYGWQDWPAFHRVAGTERGRIRFYVSAPRASDQDTARVRALAEHEYRVMSRLAHEGLLRPRDLVDGDLGVGLVYPHYARSQRHALPLVR